MDTEEIGKMLMPIRQVIQRGIAEKIIKDVDMDINTAIRCIPWLIIGSVSVFRKQSGYRKGLRSGLGHHKAVKIFIFIIT